jgi:TatD DNase family protein
MEELPEILAIANKYDNLWCSVGVHPNNVTQENQVSATQLIQATANKKIISIGETGLDYHYQHAPIQEQILSFIEHIETAQDTQLPLIIHTRNADADTIEILQNQTKKGKFSFNIQ